MKTHAGTTTVAPGFYWHVKGWEIVPVSDHADTLPGPESARYLRVPAIAMLLAAPMMGAALVMFMPFIGFAMLGQALWRKVTAPNAAPADLAAQRAER